MTNRQLLVSVLTFVARAVKFNSLIFPSLQTQTSIEPVNNNYA